MESKQKSWPHRYVVSVSNISGGIFKYKVTTWLNEKKAIALAAIEHEKRYGSDPKNSLYDLSVEDIGPSPSDPSGLAYIPDGDLGDMMEF
jgi:hypothetical protein